MVTEPSEDSAALFAPGQRFTPICGGSDAESPTPRCAYCEQPHGPRDCILIHGDRLHVQCLGLLISDPTLELPASLRPRTTELLAESRRRRQGNGAKTIAAANDSRPSAKHPAKLIITIAGLLRDAPGEGICDACLAFVCKTALVEVRATTGILALSDEFTNAPRCSSCRRTVPALVYQP